MKTITNFNMYGCDIDEFIEDITDSVTYRVSGASMIVAGLMSDAQELIAFERPEQARQTLNRAKAVLFKIMDGELVGTVERV
jgi:hypothetical protein